MKLLNQNFAPLIIFSTKTLSRIHCIQIALPLIESTLLHHATFALITLTSQMEKPVEGSTERVNIIKTLKKKYFYYYKTVKTFSYCNKGMF